MVADALPLPDNINEPDANVVAFATINVFLFSGKLVALYNTSGISNFLAKIHKSNVVK